MRFGAVLVGCVLVTAAGIVAPGMHRAAAGTDPAPRGVSWQSAGDSYSSGEGVFGNVGGCAQSDQAYGPAVARTLRGRGWDIRNETFTACTGGRVEDYFVPRPDGDTDTSLWDWGREQEGPDQVDVITLSFGGNDIGFAPLITGCLIGLPDSWGEFLALGPVGSVAGSLSGCDESEADLNARIDALLDPPRACNGTRRTGEAGFDCDLALDGRRGSIIDFYYDIVTKHLTNRGRLYVVGYPRVFADTNQWPLWSKIACQGVLRGDTEKLGRVAAHFNDKLQEAVRRANQALGATRVVYIDQLAYYRDGLHELCGTGDDWLNGISNNRDTTGELRIEGSFHPNAAGHAGTAAKMVDIVALGADRIRITNDNIGPVVIGMTVAEAERALGMPLQYPTRARLVCVFAESPALPNASLLIVDGVIVAAQAGNGYVTPSGVVVGMPVADLAATVGPSLQSQPYVSNKTTTEYFVVGSNNNAILFTENRDSGMVRSIRIGHREWVVGIESWCI